MTDLHASVRTLARLARLLEWASGDLSLPQYRVLATVSEGDERASRLAERLALARPTITAAVDGLVDRGLLTRSEVAGDRRAVRLTITPAGRKALRSAEEAMAERLAPLFDRLDDRSRALAALGDLQTAIDQALEERRATAAR